MSDVLIYSSDSAFVTSLLEHKIENVSFCSCDKVNLFPAVLSHEKPKLLIVDAVADTQGAKEVLESIACDLHVLVVADNNLSKEFPIISEEITSPVKIGYILDRINYYLNVVPLFEDKIVALRPMLTLDVNNRQLLYKDAQTVKLTEKETVLLDFLASSPAPKSRQDVLRSVWGYADNIETKTLETHIYQLRKKLETLNSDFVQLLVSRDGFLYLSN